MAEAKDLLFSSPDFSGFLFNNLSSAIFLVDRDFHVKQVNDAYQSLFSKGEAEVIGELCGNALGCAFAVEENKPCGSTEACTACTIRNSISKGFSDREVQSAYITRNFYINGEAKKKYLRMKTRTVNYQGTELAIIAVDDITELEEQTNRIRDMANRDFLTNLYNRRYFFDIGSSLYENAKRGNISISVAMFDIDHFKRVNDTHGHAAGDFVLKSISDILFKNMRRADLLARFGGEEFCIMLHCTGGDDPYTVIDKLRLLVEQHEFIYDQRKIDVTISAGLTGALENSLEDMIKRADEMLYRAKQLGRDRTEEYVPT